MIRAIVVAVVSVFFKLWFKINIMNYERFEKLKTGCIVAPNHISIWETLIIPCLSKRLMYMMAKEELFKNKFNKWFFGKMKVFPIKRGKNDLTAVKTAVKLLRDGKSVCIFPQGTRVKATDKKLHFKSGVIMIAHAAKVPIVPVGVVADYKFRSKVNIVYGEPVYFTDLYDKKLTKEDIDVALKKLEESVMKAINIAKGK